MNTNPENHTGANAAALQLSHTSHLPAPPQPNAAHPIASPTEADLDILQEFELLDGGKNSTFFPRFSSFSSFFRQVLCGTKPVSSFKNLTEEQHEQILDWLLDHTVAKTRELIARPISEGGMDKKIGLTSIWRYRRNYLAAYTALLQAQDLVDASKIQSSASDSDLQVLNDATLRALRHLLFALVNRKSDPAKIRALYSVLQKFADQSLAIRRIEILEQKADAYDKAKKELERPHVNPIQLAINVKKYFGIQ